MKYRMQNVTETEYPACTYSTTPSEDKYYAVLKRCKQETARSVTDSSSLVCLYCTCYAVVLYKYRTTVCTVGYR